MKFEILPITGDASFRKFYRVFFNSNTKIAIFANKEKYKNLIAYTAVNKFLLNNKILTPKLYNYNFKKGVILIEDFGDESLHKKITKKKK